VSVLGAMPEQVPPRASKGPDWQHGAVDLESEPLRYTGHLVRRVQQFHVAAWSRHVSATVSSPQFAALTVLERRPGASQSELCAELDLDRATVAEIVRRMSERGLIERAPSHTDRRRNVLNLTGLGRSELNRLRPLVVDLEEHLLGGFDEDERAQFRSLLRRIVTKDPGGGPAADG
jgi:DNA-binding MarR family transcriptional regulator